MVKPYKFHCLDSRGELTTGEIEAANELEARELLESKGLLVQQIEPLPEAKDAESDPRKDLPQQSLQEITRQLLRSIWKDRDHITPVILALAAEIHHSKTQNDLRYLASELDSASSPDDLESSKQIMQWLPVLASGLGDQNSKQNLTNMISHAVRDNEIRTERRRLLAYPAFLAMGVAFVFSLFIYIVVPTFEEIFEDFGLELPGSTELVINLSREIRFNPIRMLSKTAGLIAVTVALQKLCSWTGLTHRLFGFIFAGNSASVSLMSILSSQLAELLKLGLPLGSAIRLSANGVKSHYYRNACVRLAKEAEKNSKLSETKIGKRFPPNMILALETDPGPNVPLLRELSVLYAERVHCRVDWTSGAISQLAIVMLGIAIGFTVAFLLAPLFTLIYHLGG